MKLPVVPATCHCTVTGSKLCTTICAPSKYLTVARNQPAEVLKNSRERSGAVGSRVIQLLQ